MRTSMAMDRAPVSGPGRGHGSCGRHWFCLSQDSTGEPTGSFRRRRHVLPRPVLYPAVPPSDPYFFLAHLTVHDTERPELGAVRLPRGNQDVVRPGLAGVGDVGTGRVSL